MTIRRKKPIEIMKTHYCKTIVVPMNNLEYLFVMLITTLLFGKKKK